MILWEIKKIIRSKFFIVSLLLIIALYVFDSRFPNDVKIISAQNKFFDELLMNEEEYETYALPYYEKLDKIDTMRLFGMEGVYLDTAYYDYRVIGELKKKKEYVSEQYEKVMIDTVKKSVVSMGKSDSFFEKKLYETHISTYNTWVDVVEVNEKGIEPFHFKIFHEPTIGMVLILWCVALSAQVIGFEEHKNLKLMVSSVYRGRKENLLSKIAAVAIIVAVVKMSMVVLNIIQGPIFYGVSFRTLFAPIQSLEEYQMCNFHISIMGFFLLVGLGQLILLELVVCITSVLSYFTKAIPAAAVSLIIWEVPVFLLDRATFDTYFEIERFNKIRQYAPWALNSSVDYFYSFDYGKFIIFPVNRFIMCITVCLVIMGVCVALCAGFADKINRGSDMELKVTDISKKFRNKKALDGFSCTFTEGINILLGPNGAGKSTLMNGIADAIKIDSGNIEYDGDNIYKMGRNFRKILGYLPQNPEFYPFFKGREIIDYFATLKGLKKNEYNADELMAAVNLSDAIDRKCGGYSGGMRRRLGIAVTMLGNPKVMIFDEPTAGLDPKERLTFKENLKQLAKDRIVIMATHIISDAEDIGTKMVLINNGKKLTEGSMEELIKDTETKTGKSGISLDDVYMQWFG